MLFFTMDVVVGGFMSRGYLFRCPAICSRILVSLSGGVIWCPICHGLNRA